MPAARVSLRTLAVLSTVTRELVDDIARKGGPIVDAHRQVLDRVDAFVGGGKPPTKAEAARSIAAIAAAGAAFGVGSPPAEKAVYWLGGPLRRLMKMAEDGWDDTGEA